MEAKSFGEQEEVASISADRETFARLYRDTVERLTDYTARRVGNPSEVADVVAATYVVALERADAYDPNLGEPIGWLIGIAARLLANQRRRLAREYLAKARINAHSLLDEGDVERLESYIDASAECVRLRQALETLSDAQREILLLVGEDSITPAAAAHTLGLRPSTYRVRLSRARRALRAAMESPDVVARFQVQTLSFREAMP